MKSKYLNIDLYIFNFFSFFPYSKKEKKKENGIPLHFFSYFFLPKTHTEENNASNKIYINVCVKKKKKIPLMR